MSRQIISAIQNPPGSQPIQSGAPENTNKLAPKPAGPPGSVPTPMCSQTVVGAAYDTDSLSRAIKAGFRSFQGCTIKNARLAGLDLFGFYFVKCVMHNADVRAVSGVQLNFDGSDLTGSDFSNACLMQAKLSQCNLTSSVFSATNLKGADLSGSNTVDADFTGAVRFKNDPAISGWQNVNGTLRRAARD